MRRGMIIETDHMSVKARQRGAGDPRGRRNYPRRDLEPQLGRPGQPEAHPEPRRPGRADHARGQRLRGRTGARSAPTATRATSSASASARTSTACTPSPGRGRTPLRTPCATRSARSTARACIDKQRSGTRVYDINTDGVDHYGLYPDWVEDLRKVARPRRSWRTWPTAPRPTCRCGSAPRRPRPPSRTAR